MRAKALMLIVTLVHSLLVQGLGLEFLHKNSTTDLNRRIISGDEANPADYSFVVALFNGDTRCSGSIINNYFILTAGHCLYVLDCMKIQIVATQFEGETTPTPQVTACYIHPNYVEEYYVYDIALVQTDNDMLEDGKLKAVPLPWPGTHYAQGYPAVIVGWGEKADHTYPSHLLKADVLVEDWDTCNNKYKYDHPECHTDPDVCNVRPDIPRRGLCTQGQGTIPPSACFGDSGGPVVIDNEVAGVLISSILINNVCKWGTPTLSTKVVDYLPWIYSFTEPDKDTSSFPVTDESSVVELHK